MTAQHFIVDEPMSWERGSRPCVAIDGRGRCIGMFKRTGNTLTPLIGRVVVTDREPPLQHLAINGVICYARWFIINPERVDITS